MRRGVQIVISLLAVVLLLRPFDCFANARTHEAMDCCLKGKCAPTAKADDCCKNTLPGVTLVVVSKAARHGTPVLALAAVSISPALPTPVVRASDDLLRHPPPKPALNGRNLPLLI
jgi:hypothetical protein